MHGKVLLLQSVPYNRISKVQMAHKILSMAHLCWHSIKNQFTFLKYYNKKEVNGERKVRRKEERREYRKWKGNKENH